MQPFSSFFVKNKNIPIVKLLPQLLITLNEDDRGGEKGQPQAITDIGPHSHRFNPEIHFPISNQSSNVHMTHVYSPDRQVTTQNADLPSGRMPPHQHKPHSKARRKLLRSYLYETKY